MIYNGKILAAEGLHPFDFKTSYGCDSTVIIDLKVVPKSDSIITQTICYGESYFFDGKEYTKEGTYTSKGLLNQYQCDSTVTLELKVLPEILFDLFMLPEVEGNDGQIIVRNPPAAYTYIVNGVENGPLAELKAGEYEIILVIETEDKVCLSVPQTIIIPASCLEVEITEVFSPVCVEEQSVRINYTVNVGGFERYNIHFDESALNAGLENHQNLQLVAGEFYIPFSADAAPGNYVAQISFPGQICDTLISVPFTINYSSTIITQRWDDVLGILNSTYNGGYDFSGYQWYRNGELLFGETKPYLYVAGGLNTSDLYSAELTRLNDGVSSFTCGFIPEAGSAELVLVSNTVQALSRYPIESNSDGMARIYSLTGSLISEHPIQTGSTYLPAPSESGYYLLQLTTASGTRVYHLRVTP